MAQSTVTGSELGQEIATLGLLTGITLMTVPDVNGYKEYITLSDGNHVIFNLDPSTSQVSPNTNLLSGDEIYFKSLVLASIPSGSSFLVEYALPPTLTSLSPNTAISGDVDFTLSCIGTDFTDKCIIVFGQYDEPTTLVSATTVTTIVKPSLFAPAVVPVKIRVGTYVTNSVDFTFTATSGKT